MFWNEIRKSTPLEASVLHRYFNQVRYTATKKILAGYSGADKLDLEFFKNRLFFENDEHCTTYLALHNCYPNDDGLYLVKEMKQNYTDPEEEVTAWMSGRVRTRENLNY